MARKSPKNNIMLTAAVALLALAYFSLQSGETSRTSSSVAVSPPPSPQIEGETAVQSPPSIPSTPSEAPPTAKNPPAPLSSTSPVAAVNGVEVEKLQFDADELPADLPEDLRRQLLEPPKDIPEELKAQISAPRGEVPEDILNAMKEPPRQITAEEVNQIPPEILDDSRLVEEEPPL